jgi:hypothetical protein
MTQDGMDKMDRRQREQYGSAVPAHMRRQMQGSQSGHRNMRVDARGQVIIDTEENLSDKEIYPAGNHINIPSIGKWVILESVFSSCFYLLCYYLRLSHSQLTFHPKSLDFNQDDRLNYQAWRLLINDHNWLIFYPCAVTK